VSVTELKQGRYAVVRTLGQGAQGETLEAVDKRDGRLVAIKRFPIRGAQSWKNVELAEREARVLASLDHPLLPKYIDHFEEEGALCLVMERIEGETLADLRRGGGSLEREAVWRLLADMADVLDYLHGRAPPVIHRDIKPSNVILGPDGAFRIVDFGSVRDSLKPEGGSTVVGTFGYMAPEQFQGRALPQSDVYGVGATLIALLTGREPEDLPHRGLALDIESALRGRADGELIRVLKAMLELDPDRRARSITPLLSGHVSRHRPAGERHGSHRQRERRERRDRHRSATRHAQSHRRSQKSRRSGAGLPFLIALLFVVGFIVARVAVAVSLRLVIPLVLVMLSLLLIPGVRRAAERVRSAGKRADRAMRRAQDSIRGRPARVIDTTGEEVSEPRRRVRVDDEPEEPTEELEADAPDSEQRTNLRRRDPP
jgi:serine/threonine protein kinase